MEGSWKTDISGTSVERGAVVIGPKSTVPSWICCATSRSPPRAPEWWWTTLTLPAVSSASLSMNCWDVCEVPCFAGLTLPRVSSRVCAPTGVKPARVRIATINAATRERAMMSSSRLRLSGVLAVGDGDLGLDAAAHVEVAHHLDPARPGGGGEVVQDSVGHVLVEG